jgi:hypothetical protein
VQSWRVQTPPRKQDSGQGRRAQARKGGEGTGGNLGRRWAMCSDALGGWPLFTQDNVYLEWYMG